jgi:drug/metabolite transporter (DMT)-like permease
MVTPWCVGCTSSWRCSPQHIIPVTLESYVTLFTYTASQKYSYLEYRQYRIQETRTYAILRNFNVQSPASLIFSNAELFSFWGLTTHNMSNSNNIMTMTTTTACSNDGRRQRRSRTTAACKTARTSKWALLLLILAAASRSSEAFSVQRPLAFRQQQPQQQHKLSPPSSLMPNTSTSSRRTCDSTASSTCLYVATSDTASKKSRRISSSANNQQQQQQEASFVSQSSSIATATSTTASHQPQQQQQLQEQQLQLQQQQEEDSVYRNGLWTVGGITVLFASNSPAVHAAFSMVSVPASTPPVLLLNAAVACVALISVRTAGPVLDKMIPEPSLLMDDSSVNSEASSLAVSSKSDNIIQNWIFDRTKSMAPATQAGMELGLWKFLGCTANLYGLSQTSAGHGAFLIQLTTLLVPAAQGVMGVAIPARLTGAIALALSGVFLFTQDTGAGAGGSAASVSTASMHGDALCVVAAMFYATYDLRLFQWGQRVAPLQLITNKVTTQAALSVVLLAASTALGSWTNNDNHYTKERRKESRSQIFD